MLPQPVDADFESSPDAYTVRLDRFTGPLDLLIHLIKKNEVNIYDIPISLITAQYLDYLGLIEELNLDVAGEFIVMAATLIHIKSRMLLPRPDASQEDPEEDPRAALVNRLLEYQKFKAAANLLHEREEWRSAQWQRPDQRVADIAGEEYETEVEVDLFSLMAAFKTVLDRAKQRPKRGHPGRADLHRGAHRAAAGAALGDRGLRLRGPVRRRQHASGPHRHVPGAARDDPDARRAGVPGGHVRGDSGVQTAPGLGTRDSGLGIRLPTQERRRSNGRHGRKTRRRTPAEPAAVAADPAPTAVAPDAAEPDTVALSDIPGMAMQLADAGAESYAGRGRARGVDGTQGDHRGPRVRLARAAHAQGALQAARLGAARGRGAGPGVAEGGLPSRARPADCRDRRAASRSSRARTSTSGCAASSTSARRRSSPCRPSRRSPWSPTASPSPRPRSPRSAASTPPACWARSSSASW